MLRPYLIFCAVALLLFALAQYFGAIVFQRDSGRPEEKMLRWEPACPRVIKQGCVKN